MRHTLQSAVLAAGLVLGLPAGAATYTIDFDDLAAGTTLSNQYAASTGATFAAGGAGTYDSQSQGNGSWATNTDLTVVSSTGSDTNNLGSPTLVGGNVLGSYDGWIAEDGDPVVTISFSSAISAFSADFAAVEYGSDVAIYAYSGSTLVATATGSGSGQFALSLGGNDITSVVITPGSYNDYVAVDNLSFTTAVPEPANIALLGIGLAMLALARRPGRGAAQ
jgi:hypothetical protein